MPKGKEHESEKENELTMKCLELYYMSIYCRLEIRYEDLPVFSNEDFFSEETSILDIIDRTVWNLRQIDERYKPDSFYIRRNKVLVINVVTR